MSMVDPAPDRPDTGTSPDALALPETARGSAVSRALVAILITVLLCLINRALSTGLPQPWPLWPAAGVALAFSWRYGYRWALPPLLGALPFALAQSNSALDSAALLLGVLAGPLLGVLVLQRFERWHPAQSATQSSLRFIGVILCVTAPVTMLTSVLLGRLATVGLPVSRLADFPIGLPALGMWLAGLTSLLLVTPVVLALLDLRPQGASQARVDSARWFDLPCVSMAMAMGLLMVSLTLSGQSAFGQIALFAVFPLMLWSALRNEARSHALTLFLVALPFLASSIHALRRQASTEIEFLWLGAQMCALLACATGCAIVAQALEADRLQALENTLRLGREDADTGLLNDRGLIAEMQTALGNPERPALGLIGLQVGNLAALRELCGPLEVARLESRISTVLKEALAVRPATSRQIAARWAGERFLMMTSAATVSELRLIGRDLYSRLAGEPFNGPHDSISLQISVGGILVEPGTLVQAEECLAVLDEAIVIASSVRDPQLFVEPLSQSMLASRRAQQDRTEQLREAIREGRLEIYAQPLVDPDAPEGSLAYEILTRLRDRDGELIQPPEFMPLALKAQLLAKLDRAVIHRVFEWLATHPQALARTWRCAINLSGPSLDDPGLAGFIREMRRTHDIPADRIVFEITENSAIRHASTASRLVDELKAEGFGIALDDFGTGLATFEYLKRFPLDYLKIDGSFIRNLTEDGLDEEIVMSTLRVARKLNLRAVAEHVQTEAVHLRLQALGVRYLQGDLFGRAAPIQSLFDSSWPIELASHRGRNTEDR